MTSHITELKLLRERYEHWRDEYNRTGSQRASILYHERFKAYCSYIDRHQVASSDLEILIPYSAIPENNSVLILESSADIPVNKKGEIGRKERNQQILDQRILHTLTYHKGLMRTQAISDAVGSNLDYVRQSLSRLFALKKIERVGSSASRYVWQAKK